MKSKDKEKKEYIITLFNHRLLISFKNRSFIIDKYFKTKAVRTTNIIHLVNTIITGREGWRLGVSTLFMNTNTLSREITTITNLRVSYIEA